MTIAIVTSSEAATFRTARFSEEAHTLGQALPRDPIRVEYFSETWNAFHKRMECIFSCYQSKDDASFIGTYFQNGLTAFTT